jgi:very-short-patch-repair endonuclease
MDMRRKRPLRRKAEIRDLLWQRLKVLEGWQFRKDSPFRTFILPFVEHDALLIVELETDSSSRSPIRDRLLHEAGYTILRFARADAEDNLSSVTGTIRAILEDRKS